MIRTVLAITALLFAILIGAFWIWLLSMDAAFTGGTNFSFDWADWVQDPGYFAWRFLPPLTSAALMLLAILFRKNSKARMVGVDNLHAPPIEQSPS